MAQKLINSKPKSAYSFEEIRKAYNYLNLEFTFRSVKFITDVENISWEQLRTCVYFIDGVPQYDLNRTVYYIISAGLIGSKQATTGNVEELTLNIMNDWAAKYHNLAFIYTFAIEQMENKHFFINSVKAEQISELVLSTPSMSSLSDWAKNLLTQVQSTKTLGVQAIGSILNEQQ